MLYSWNLQEGEKREFFTALVDRFRMGEIGPVTFRVEARRLRIAESEIDEMRDRYIDECAKCMRG